MQIQKESVHHNMDMTNLISEHVTFWENYCSKNPEKAFIRPLFYDLNMKVMMAALL